MVDDEGTVRASTELGRAHGHRRTRSVTRPQLFVEQSSKVARRLGLSPMPLAMHGHFDAPPGLAYSGCVLAQQSPGAAADGGRRGLEDCAGLELGLCYPACRPGSAGTLDGRADCCQHADCRGAVVFRICAAAPARHGGLGSLAVHIAAQADPWQARFFGWAILDIVGWAAMVLIVYALVVWIKLMAGTRLVQFAWVRHRDFERRTKENKGTKADTKNLKQFDDSTKKLDNDAFFEVGKLIGKEKTEAEWEKQRPKWTMDNIERYSLFKSRVP
ncbi:hypothetical protein DL89DRAFT_27984 [Linderina pennispora]|uniref:Uncharacterized protein n=1 Tax=Linderina pennispora TaxID=61395 RepID=A0A1Y1W461_9FUNG|nr:uncharacterized protein DL89DRAFT_27984 [Linderina pennispora]ORX68208.1 hypothetical protein DL89DRAFT_27984 [Linderina pennispora]